MYKMNEIVNKFLLLGDQFMPKLHLNNLLLLIVHVVHLLKTKSELKSLIRLEIQILFTEMNLIRLIFNVIWLTANQKI